MKLTIEKNETVVSKVEIDLPQYFTTLRRWFNMVLPDNKILLVADHGITINPPTVLRHIEDMVKPCTQDEFVQAYVTAINAISAASGIEHLPLLIDNTQNPES